MILYFHSAHSLRSYRKMRYRAFSHAPQCVIPFPIKVQLRRTFIPLPAPRRRGLVRRADERGLSEKVSLELFRYLRGTESPLEKQFYCFTSSITKHSMISPSLISL